MPAMASSSPPLPPPLPSPPTPDPTAKARLHLHRSGPVRAPRLRASRPTKAERIIFSFHISGPASASSSSMAAVVRGVLRGIKEKGLTNFLSDARDEGYL